MIVFALLQHRWIRPHALWRHLQVAARDVAKDGVPLLLLGHGARGRLVVAVRGEAACDGWLAPGGL